MYWSVEIEEMDERWTVTQHALGLTALRQARNAVADGTTRSVWLNQYADSGHFLGAVCVKEDMDNHGFEWGILSDSVHIYDDPVDLLDAALIEVQKCSSMRIGQFYKGQYKIILESIDMY